MARRSDIGAFPRGLPDHSGSRPLQPARCHRPRHRFAVERQVDFLQYAETTGGELSLTALRAINARHVTSFRYGQLNSPFEYEKVRYVYSRARDLMVKE